MQLFKTFSVYCESVSDSNGSPKDSLRDYGIELQRVIVIVLLQTKNFRILVFFILKLQLMSNKQLHVPYLISEQQPTQDAASGLYRLSSIFRQLDQQKGDLFVVSVDAVLRAARYQYPLLTLDKTGSLARGCPLGSWGFLFYFCFLCWRKKG